MKTVLRKLNWLYWLLFYRLYRWSEKVNGKHEPNDINASIMLSLLLVLSIFALGTIYISLFGDLPFFSGVSKLNALTIAAIILLVNYLFIRHKNNYVKAIKEFSKETPDQERRSNFWVATYGVLAFMLSVGVWMTWAILKLLE